jgi:hypothetical protein
MSGPEAQIYNMGYIVCAIAGEKCIIHIEYSLFNCKIDWLPPGKKR